MSLIVNSKINFKLFFFSNFSGSSSSSYVANEGASMSSSPGVSQSMNPASGMVANAGGTSSTTQGKKK